MLPEALRVGPRSHYPRLVVFRGMRTSNGHPAGVRPRREMVAPYTLRELERLEKADMRRQSDDQSESLYNVFALRDENGGPPPPLSRCPVLVLNADRRPLTLFPVSHSHEHVMPIASSSHSSSKRYMFQCRLNHHARFFSCSRYSSSIRRGYVAVMAHPAYLCFFCCSRGSRLRS